MRCLLLGAGGYIGQHVHRRLLAEPRLSVVTASRGAAHGQVHLDLASAGPARIAAVLRQVGADVVINCAGVTAGSPQQLTVGNVTTVAHLLAGLDAHDRPVRLVHLGSAAEYGAVSPGQPVDEDAPACPVSAYGCSKLGGTELVLAARRGGRDAVVLRVFNPIGPGTPPTLLPGRLVAELREAADTGRLARVGRLDGHRDLVDVRDVAAAVVAAATAPQALAPILNVGSGHATALRELAALAATLIGVAPPIEDDTGSARSASVPWQQADLTRIRRTLGWQPRVPLTESLRDMGLTAGAVPSR